MVWSYRGESKKQQTLSVIDIATGNPTQIGNQIKNLPEKQISVVILKTK
jgi:hypothetical protein